MTVAARACGAGKCWVFEMASSAGEARGVGGDEYGGEEEGEGE